MGDKARGGEGASKNKPPESEDQSQLLAGLEDLLREEEYEASDEALTADEAPAPPAETATPKQPAAGKKRTVRDTGGRERRARERQVFKDLDAQLATEAAGVEIADDRLTAHLTRVGSEDTYAGITALLASHKVCAGIDHEAIRAALAKARSEGPQYEVLVASGHPPVVRSPGGPRYHLPPELIPRKTEAGLEPTPFDALRQILGAPSLGTVVAWPAPIKLVHPGEVIAEFRPPEVDPGQDVLGKEIVPELAPPEPLRAGEHTALSADGTRCVAQLYGYAGLVDGVPAVALPLWTSPSQDEARFVHLPPAVAATPPTREEVAAVLEAKWVTHGVLPKRVTGLCRQLALAMGSPLTVTVAQGQPAQPGETAKVTYRFPLEELPPWNLLQRMSRCKDLGSLEAALDELLATEGIRCRSVRPGEVLVEKTPPTAGTPGKDIQGEEVAAEEGKDVELQTGENVTLAEDGLQCTADIYGYACRHASQVSVVSPLWMGEDKETLYFLNLAELPPARFPSLEEIQPLVDRQGKEIQGFNAERWTEILRGLRADECSERLVVVAEGTPVQHGRDAVFDWRVDIVERPGTILADGSIDFRDRHLVTVVDEGGLIGHLTPSQPGVPGRNLFGGVINPPVPLEIEVVTGAQVTAEHADEGTAYRATVAGGVMRTEEIKEDGGRARKTIKIDLYRIFSVETDVDYNTGNITFTGDVHIKGSVRSGFTVEATGSVHVGEVVEAGARVKAGGDILVQSGVVGDETRLEAGGQVMAKYIQGATVLAGGDVTAGTYFLEATVRAAGTVTAQGQGEGEGLAMVGGMIWGAKGIEARSLGTPANTALRVVTGVDPFAVARLEELRAGMRTCEAQQHKVLQAVFGLSRPDPALIKQKVRLCANPQQKATMLRGVKALSQLTEKRQRLHEELQALLETQRQLASQAAIVANEHLYAGVEVRVGEHTLRVREDQQHVRVRLVEEEERTSIQILTL